MKMTYEIAMAAGWDEVTRHARKAGRTSWNEDDYNAGVELFERLWSVEDDLASRYGARVEVAR